MSEYYSAFNPYQYTGTVTRVVDADTVDAVVDLGFGLKMSQRFRIEGDDEDYDAPETYGVKSLLEKEHGLAATARAKELLLDKELKFITSKTAGIYGRYGAMIILEDGSDYASVMISEGFVKKESYE